MNVNILITRFYVGFEILRAVTRDGSSLCDLTFSSSIQIHWRFGVPYFLHIQGRIIWATRCYIPERSALLTRSCSLNTWFGDKIIIPVITQGIFFRKVATSRYGVTSKMAQTHHMCMCAHDSSLGTSLLPQNLCESFTWVVSEKETGIQYIATRSMSIKTF